MGSMFNRSSARLNQHDYSSPCLYFITICTFNYSHTLGDIVGDQVVLSEFGTIVHDEWEKSENIRNEIKLHDYVIMPNHFHCIAEILPRAEKRANAVRPYMGDKSHMQSCYSVFLKAEVLSAVQKVGSNCIYHL